ncbi:MAG: hypothetical protein QOE41_4212 [Mycobacterium sp.]|jgi:hypothetical protein|nr:hypothetical protein [Mycobacterium sp.]
MIGKRSTLLLALLKESIAMPSLKFRTAIFLAAGVTAGMVFVPTASALPQCTNTTPTTTQCERPGNAQINTTPSASTADNYPFGWPWWGNGGGISIGIGGFGR